MVSRNVEPLAKGYRSSLADSVVLIAFAGGEMMDMVTYKSNPYIVTAILISEVVGESLCYAHSRGLKLCAWTTIRIERFIGSV